MIKRSMSVAAEFLSEYRALFERHRGSVATTSGRALPPSIAEVVLNRFLTRALLVAFLQSRGWLSFRGRRDYLQALYEDWSASPGAHLFQQRLALVFYSALDESRATARGVLEPQIGTVPFIGGGVFSPEMHEREFDSGRGVAVLPEAMFAELVGLLSRFTFSLNEGDEDAVTPEAMGAALAAFLGKGEVPVYENTESHRRAVRRLIAAQLGLNASLKLPREKAELRERVRGLHVFDDECGSGTYLVAALEELTDVAVRIEGSERGQTKRRVAHENLRGLDKSELAVQVARFRLALALLAGDEEPRPLPDLRQIIKVGGALVSTKPFPPEGPTVEYKASFEWDPRRAQRSPEMRFGSLRTVAAFLNADGGTLYIGVDDDGVPLGIEDDLALIPDASPLDVFEGRFREFLKNSLDPLPLNGVTLAFPEVEGVTLCEVTVAPSNVVTYLRHKDANGQAQESVFVRDGNRTIELKGRDRDTFVLARSQSPGSPTR